MEDSFDTDPLGCAIVTNFNMFLINEPVDFIELERLEALIINPKYFVEL